MGLGGTTQVAVNGTEKQMEREACGMRSGYGGAPSWMTPRRNAATDTLLAAASAAPATTTGCAASRGRRCCQRGLRSENLLERLVGALLVGVSAADAYRADEVIVHDDGQAAADEVVAESLVLTEVQADQSAIHVAEALRNRGRRGTRV